MLKRKPFIILCFALILAIAACTKSNQPIGTGSGFCDTSAVTYTQDILPLMQSYCFGCHGNGNTVFSNGIGFEGSDGLEYLKFFADKGYLVGDVKHNDGYTGMPYGKPKLSACEINKIVAWVNQGKH